MNQDQIVVAVAEDLHLDVKRVSPAVRLLDEGNTVPFIARYRKELTGTLDEEELRQVLRRVEYRRTLEQRRETILASLEQQGVLTAALRASVETADTQQRLEDAYRPYRPQRRTRGAIARQKGLQPLADLILQQPLEGQRIVYAEPYLNADVGSVEEAYNGARDIVAETIAAHPGVRGQLRQLIQRRGHFVVSRVEEGKDDKALYQLYYDFYSSFAELRPHQILAINRGEKEGVLKVALEVSDAESLGILGHNFPADPGSVLEEDMIQARQDGYQRLLFPSLVREARRDLKEKADQHAINVFATNLRSLLLQPPLKGHIVLGIDPGYRTGSKLAVVDATGKVLATRTIYPDRRHEQAQQTLQHLIGKYAVTLIAIGNGTASREVEAFVADFIALSESPVKYTIVSEAGASVYSASETARMELPDLDVSLRGAVSIARRLQDPLAELVKIDPKAIGVGLYQHDVDQRELAQALDAVVESTVNAVGADLNTASPSLLRYISGIGQKMAERIVEYRDACGAFRKRQDLLDVPGLGERTFQQAAGFLRIDGGECPLDRTSIHPESYPVAESMLELLLPSDKKTLADCFISSLDAPTLQLEIDRLRTEMDLTELATTLGTGVPTLVDVLDALARPGRDPREELSGPILRSDVLKIEDLSPGMHLQGTVRNVVDFGAFVDIGVKRNGLIHISRMGQDYVRNPHEKVTVGDVVEVEVVEVDIARGRISLELIE